MTDGTGQVTVVVPGSTSNCGSGFDTLGLALNVYNRVTVERLGATEARTGAPGLRVGQGGEAGSCAPVAQRTSDARAQTMVAETAEAFFEAAGRPPEPFRYRIDGDVPPARGLGSSVTVIAGILAGLNALHGAGLSRERLVGVATAIEGHPDNASAGILGGFCVSRTDPDTGAYIDCIRAELPESLAFVVVSPELELRTKESRGALPESLPYFDAVRSVNGASYLVAAFLSGDYGKLRHVRGDFMHEPYRLPRIPGGAASIDAGIAAGALTGWLSGSGSSVLCVSGRADADRVRSAMEGAFAAVGIGAAGRILTADNRGLRVEPVPAASGTAR